MIFTRPNNRYSFSQLFMDFNLEIRIPRLQRDYAQGRESAKIVRSDFLHTLYDYLAEGRTNRDLDFIYGSLEKSGKKAEKERIFFVPLDGQQRLTTLFLLHWYLAQIAGPIKKTELRDILTREGRSRFIYDTRESSNQFCDQLVNYNFSDNGKQKISEQIKNETWFFNYWKQDPTIQSMLIMLDEISGLFHGCANFFDKLIDPANPVITFIIMDLGEYRLSDELYIKMNSRDKPLTEYEKIKASLIKYLQQHQSELPAMEIRLGDVVKTLSFDRYFALNCDTTWTDMLWNFCVKDKDLDGRFTNLIRGLLYGIYASTQKMDKEVWEKLNILQRYPGNLSWHVYDKELGCISPKAIEKLAEALDALVDIRPGDDNPFSSSSNFDPLALFENVLANKLTLPERIIFYAYVMFRIWYGKDHTGFSDWMRVIYNLAFFENTATDSDEGAMRGIKAIDELIPHATEILGYLRKKPRESPIPYFSSWQVREERIKAHLLNIGDKWRQAITQAEKHSYFNSQIGFLLYLAGIETYFDKHHDCAWSKTDDNEFYNRFMDYYQKIDPIFSGGYEDRLRENSCFERAALAKGDYLSGSLTERRNTLSSCDYRVRRDYSWRRYLRLEKENFSRMEIVRDVIDDERYDPALPVKSLEKICSDVRDLDGWRKILISEPDIMNDYCEQGFIHFGYPLMIFRASGINHYHADLYSYALYLSMHRTDIPEIYEYDYVEVRNSWDTPFVNIAFKYLQNGYVIKIFSEYDGNNKFTGYIMNFQRDRKRPVPIKDQTILNFLNAKFNDVAGDSVLYEKKTRSKQTVRNILSQLSAIIMPHQDNEE